MLSGIHNDFLCYIGATLMFIANDMYKLQSCSSSILASFPGSVLLGKLLLGRIFHQIWLLPANHSTTYGISNVVSAQGGSGGLHR